MIDLQPNTKYRPSSKPIKRNALVLFPELLIKVGLANLNFKYRIIKNHHLRKNNDIGSYVALSSVSVAQLS